MSWTFGGLLGDLSRWQAPGTTDAQVAAGTAAQNIIQNGSGVDPTTGQYVQLGDNSNAALIANGAWTDAEAQQVGADYSADQAAYNTGTITTAFTDQLKAEGAAIGDAAAHPLSTVLPKIPWQWWLLGGIAIFVYLGGLGFLARRGRERLSR